VVVHVPNTPIGNSSIFLPFKQYSFSEFEEYTKVIQEMGIIPIAGLDSTCQGNLEAHSEHNKATMQLLQSLKTIGYSEILLSSPNNVGFFKEQYQGAKIYVSYSQYITSMNRARIFSNIGAHSIILHPDIIRSFNSLKNFMKMKAQSNNGKSLDFIIPLNIGCNWGCIYWYQHHNLQSHRTINSPIFWDQMNVSDVQDGYDYSLLNCWKQRIEKPVSFLKGGWVSPWNIIEYENLGFNYFFFSTYQLSVSKIMNILKSYMEKSTDLNLFDYIRIPTPYGDYWDPNTMNASIYEFNSLNVKDFCHDFPYNAPFPFEEQISQYCSDFNKKIIVKDPNQKERMLTLINKKIGEIQKGVGKKEK